MAPKRGSEVYSAIRATRSQCSGWSDYRPAALPAFKSQADRASLPSQQRIPLGPALSRRGGLAVLLVTRQPAGCRRSATLDRLPDEHQPRCQFHARAGSRTLGVQMARTSGCRKTRFSILTSKDELASCLENRRDRRWVKRVPLHRGSSVPRIPRLALRAGHTVQNRKVAVR